MCLVSQVFTPHFNYALLVTILIEHIPLYEYIMYQTQQILICSFII